MMRVILVLGTTLGLVACTPPDYRHADGAPGYYRDWQGKWVVINYWAEWCAPCREEIPELNSLYDERKNRDLLVIGVNFDGIAGADLEALIERMGIAFPVIVGTPRTHWQYPLPAVLPTSVVIRPDGSLAATLVGPQTRETIEQAMESAPSGEGATGG